MNNPVVVMISANSEWQATLEILSPAALQTAPLGGWFEKTIPVGEVQRQVIFFHGGWGKIAAAASAQYVLDRWQPACLINLGTCGGFAGRVEQGAVILVERTLVYDIYEQMGDPLEHLAHYATEIDLSWLKKPYPQAVVQTLLVSGDRDLVPAEIAGLHQSYGALAGDWESGAIAWVAQRFPVRLLILRAVSDLVSEERGEAYGDPELFRLRTRTIMAGLLDTLPGWLECALSGA